MDFYMIQTEQQLRKIIKKTLMLNETGIELDDVISGFQKDFQTQLSNPDKSNAITTIRKNNVLLEIILYLIENYKAENFEDFYKKSGFIKDSDSQEIKKNFLAEQEKKRNDDLKEITAKVKSFLNRLDEISDNVGFIKQLDTLKKDLNNYIPQWYVLQYLFYNINNKNFNKILDEIAKKESNFYSVGEIKKYFINEAKFFGVMKDITATIAKNINENRLEERQKAEILSDTVRSGEFAEGIEKGDWEWLTDIIDDTVSFFFPSLRSITSEIKSFFELAEKAAGGKEAMQKKLDELMKNNSVKSVLEGIGLGKIPSDTELEKALDVMEAIKNMNN